MNTDIGIGAAVINTDKFVLIPAVLMGVNFKNHSERMYGIKLSEQLVQFEVGADVYAMYRFTDFFGMFLSCKGMFQVGKWQIVGRYEGESETIRLGRLKNLVVKPSVGVSFMF